MNKEHDMEEEEEDRNDSKEDQLRVPVTSVWTQSVDSSAGCLTPGSSVVQSIAGIKSVIWLCWRKLWRIQIFC